MSRFRKAYTAAILAALGSVATAMVEGRSPQTASAWLGLLLLGLATGVLAGVATYAVRNTGPGLNQWGSDVSTRTRGYNGPRYDTGRAPVTTPEPTVIRRPPARKKETP